MTDSVVGTALWNGLVRQIAFRSHACDNAQDHPHTACRKLVRHRVTAPANFLDAQSVRVDMQSGSVMGALPELRIDELRLWPPSVKKESETSMN